MCSDAFEKLIEPLIRKGLKNVLEIGAQAGYTTKKLLRTCREVNGRVSSVDPSPQFDPDHDLNLFAMFSIDFLEMTNEKYDLIIIDGDHNWYTVFTELSLIEKRFLLAEGGTLVHHDICWPYARRDLYYFPETIPRVYRHPCGIGGVIPGRNGLFKKGVTVDGHQPLNPTSCHALFEGGSQNGVLTAIEDYLMKTRIAWRAAFHFDACISILTRAM